MRKLNRDINKTSLTLRLQPHEAIRFWNVFDKAYGREPDIEKTDIIRDLLGIPEEGPFLTQDEILYFQRGKSTESE